MKKKLLLLFVCIFSLASCEKKQTVEYIVIKYTMPFEDLFDNNKFTKLKIDEIKFLTYANDSTAISQTSKYVNDLKNHATERLEKVISGEEKSNNIWEMQAKARACQELINNQASIIKVTYKSELDKKKYKSEIKEAFPDLNKIKKINDKYKISSEFLELE